MSQITTDFNVAVQALLAETVVAIPTETVYGLAALATSERAIQQVFAFKKRPLTHPLILHIPEHFPLKAWVDGIPEEAYALMAAFWPGPLTIVFPKKAKGVSDLITGGQVSIAIRCPAHPLAQQLLQTLNQPLVAPSANVFGQVSPTTAMHVQNDFRNEPVLILDGGRCCLGIESTIIALHDKSGYQLLRPGALSETALQAHMKCKKTQTMTVRVPGQMEKHYQPKIPLYCFQDEAALAAAYTRDQKIFVLAFEDNSEVDQRYFFKLPKDPAAVAFALYYQLHWIETLPVEAIYTVLPPDTAAWQGVRDRLSRASSVIF